MERSKKYLIFLTFIVYVIQLVLNSYASHGGPESTLFPHSIANVSRKFHLDITPAPQTFAIWGVIFILQLCWMIYSLLSVIRTDPAADILSRGFYIAFIFNISFVIMWDFFWTRQEGIISFAALVLGQIFISIACSLCLYDLREFLDEHKEYKSGDVDVWVQRILIQNGLLFYATWTMFATLIGFAIVLAYYVEMGSRFASAISLSILGVLSIFWFFVENIVFYRYMVYTISPYIVLMIGLIGIMANVNKIDKFVAALALVLLMMTAFFFVIRCFIIYIRHNKLYSKKVKETQCEVLVE